MFQTEWLYNVTDREKKLSLFFKGNKRYKILTIRAELYLTLIRTKHKT